jgi:hypothetical protein
MKMQAVKFSEAFRNMYIFHGPVVERPHFIRGGACSIPGKDIILKLEEVLVRNVIHVIHYVPVLLPNPNLVVHNVFHYVPLPPPLTSPSSEHLRNQQRCIKYIICVSGT